MSTRQRFDASAVLAQLQPFQRNTVEHVVENFYGDDRTSRFLVADETGLGKSIVAKGVIAKAIEKLQDDGSVNRIDIVYVCSNIDLARQNLSRLNVTTGSGSRCRQQAVVACDAYQRTDQGRRSVAEAHQADLLHARNVLRY